MTQAARNDRPASEFDFGPYSEERARIDRITRRLDETSDPSERADLGSELVRSISRYEDTFERAIVPRLTDRSDLVKQDETRDEMRQAMDEIHHRTTGIDPRNVHASDGEGFEIHLDAVVHKIRALLPIEDRETATLVGSLIATEQHQLEKAVVHAFKSASERPYPPHTAVGRFISNAHVKLDHTLEDVATPHHPGADTVRG